MRRRRRRRKMRASRRSLAEPGWSRLSRFTIPDKHNYILQLRRTLGATWSYWRVVLGEDRSLLRGTRRATVRAKMSKGRLANRWSPSFYCQIDWIGDLWSIS